MKALRIFLLLAFAVAFNQLQAQTDKGCWLLGGTAGFNSTTTKFGEEDFTVSVVNISPNAGYFVIDDLAVGLTLGAQFFGGDADGSSIEASPFVRYYFAETGDFKFFGQGRIGFGSEDPGGDFDSQSVFSWGVLGGVNYFLNSSVALEATLGFNSRSLEDADDPANTFGFNIGVQAFICGGQ